MAVDFHEHTSHYITVTARCASDVSTAAVACTSLIAVPDAHKTGKDQYGNNYWYNQAAGTNPTYANQGGGVDNADFLIYVTAQTQVRSLLFQSKFHFS